MPNDDPHYIALMHVPEPTSVEVGALGTFDVPAGDYAYVGRAKSGFDARLERHRRTREKAMRWHVDYLRDRARWIEARTPAADSECALADRLAAEPSTSRFIDGFGASDCRCDGHLLALGDDRRELPGDLWSGDGIQAEYLERPNRFVLLARLDDGTKVRAYLPNTARLTELLEPGRRILLTPADDPDRSTDYTVRRFWDGTWVSVEAVRAETMLEEYLRRSGRLHPFGAIERWSSQIEYADHRFDYALETAAGRRIWLEVKSLSRCFDGTAVLSGTPSSRGVEQLATLAELAESGETAAVAFVVQRGDPEELTVGAPGVDGHIDEDWIAAVRHAAGAGVEILAFRCRVTPSNFWIEDALPVRDQS